MKIKDQELWEKRAANNSDSYGAAILRYAVQWADLMEVKMAEGVALEDCAKQLSHEANTEGITGYMYWAAVSTLSWSWEHGEQLRQWHNLEVQIGVEGEKANRDGTILNPAIIVGCRPEMPV